MRQDGIRRACEREGASIGDVWSSARRDALVGEIAAVERSYAASTAERTAQWLDAWASEWSDVRRDICLAHRIDETLDDETATRALQCLDERRVVFEATVDELAAGGETVALRGVGTAASLPVVDACRDPAYLRQLPAFADGDLAEARRIRLLLLEARRAFRSGRYADGIAEAETALAAAKAAEVDALIAESRYVLGAISPRVGDEARARELLRSAYLEGTQAGALEVATLAATNLLALSSIEPGEAEAWADAARAALHGWDPDATGLVAAGLLGNLGLLEMRLQHPGRAEALLGQALQICERELGPRHPRSLALHISLGQVADARGESQAAIDHKTAAAQGFAETLGEGHPNTGIAYSSLAGSLLAADRVDEAVEAARRATAVFDESDPSMANDPQRALALETLASALIASDRPTEARGPNLAAQEILRAHGRHQRPGAHPRARARARRSGRRGGSGRLALARRAIGGDGRVLLLRLRVAHEDHRQREGEHRGAGDEPGSFALTGDAIGDRHVRHQCDRRDGQQTEHDATGTVEELDAHQARLAGPVSLAAPAAQRLRLAEVHRALFAEATATTIDHGALRQPEVQSQPKKLSRPMQSSDTTVKFSAVSLHVYVY